jgi:hypothetical protein
VPSSEIDMSVEVKIQTVLQIGKRGRELPQVQHITIKTQKIIN